MLEAVATTLGRTLTHWRSTVTEPTDGGYLYGYDLELRNGWGVAERRLVFVEDVERRGDLPGVLRVPASGLDAAVTVWIYPDDPELPTLRGLVDLGSVTARFARLGITTEVRSTEVVSYRPSKRAVVRVDTGVGHLYLKIVEPAQIEAIVRRHEKFLLAGLPVPVVLAWDPDGVLALRELPGVDAQSSIARLRDIDRFLDGVEALAARLATVPAGESARTSLYRRLDWYLDRVAARMPGEGARIRSIGARILEVGGAGQLSELTPVTVHGDLHLGQLFVDPEDPSHITGMIDIDTAGAGDPADDAAAFYAHLVTLGEVASAGDPGYAAICWRLAERAMERWTARGDHAFICRVRAIAATHLLGHALRPLSPDARGTSIRLVGRAESLVR